MNKLIQIRGGNASGKTTIIRNLIEEFGPTVDTLRPMVSKKERVLYSYLPKANLYILGSYRVVFGGLDSYDSIAETFENLSELIVKGNVICEGMRASGSINPWNEYLKPQLDNGVEVHQVLLNTTLDQMLEGAASRTGKSISDFTERQIKDRAAIRKSIEKQSKTWKELDSRYKVIYDGRDECNAYVRNLVQEMVSANVN